MDLLEIDLNNLFLIYANKERNKDFIKFYNREIIVKLLSKFSLLENYLGYLKYIFFYTGNYVIEVFFKSEPSNYS